MVDGQRQSYYGPTRADALAGRERAANHDHRQAAAREGATVADFAAEWLAAARRANGVGFLKMQPAGPPLAPFLSSSMPVPRDGHEDRGDHDHHRRWWRRLAAAVPDQPDDAGHGRPDNCRDIRQVGQEGHGLVVSRLGTCPHVARPSAENLQTRALGLTQQPAAKARSPARSLLYVPVSVACAAGEAPSVWSVATVPLSSAGRM